MSLLHIPQPCFDDCGMMCRGTKSTILKDDLFAPNKHSIPATNICHVIDGGSLLQRLQWDKGNLFGDICKSYIVYVYQNYVDPIVVFDGYDTPSTKDHAHVIRQEGVADTTAVITDDMIFTTKKAQFLKNSENKANFIKLLAKAMAEDDIDVDTSTVDADTLIVQQAIKAAQYTASVVIGEDTDLLLLLCYYTKETSKDIYFKYGTADSNKAWHIQQLQRKLRPEFCQDILTLHTYFGCDTTSSLFNIGKTACLKLYKDKGFREAASLLRLPNVPKEEIHQAGNVIMVATYNGSKGKDLDELCHEKYVQKKKVTDFVHPQTMPPTKGGTCKHSERVYLTVQDWLGKSLNPVQWGWELVDGRYKPVYTDLPAGPQSLLDYIRCGCSTSNCAGGRCTCQRLGLQCSSLYKECKGVTCQNRMSSDDEANPIEDFADLCERNIVVKM